MRIPADKKVVCLTGKVWTKARASDPRVMLEQYGFIQPNWFSTGLPVTKSGMFSIPGGDFRRFKLEHEILAFVEFGGDQIGILKQDLEETLTTCKRGALIVGPQEIAAQVAEEISQAVVITLLDENMPLSRELVDAKKRSQVNRINIDTLKTRAWDNAHKEISKILNFNLE